jgi:hypothetical protein
VVRSSAGVAFYETAIEVIEIIHLPDASPLNIERDGTTMVISGGDVAIDMLPSNTETLASDGVHGEHDHYDYYPGNAYVAAGAASLVVELTEEFVGRSLEIVVSDPWAFADGTGSNRFRARVLRYEAAVLDGRDVMLLAFERSVESYGTRFEHFVAVPEMNGAPDVLAGGSSVELELFGVASAHSLDLDLAARGWRGWRGGLAGRGRAALLMEQSEC